jgi:acyl-CoA oxidase
VRAPIASGIEQQRQDEARAHYAALEASGKAPISERALHKQKKNAKKA